MTTQQLRSAASLIAFLALTTAPTARAQHGGSGSSGSGGALTGNAPGGPADGKVAAAASSGWSRYYPFYITTVTPSGVVYTYVPPPFGAPPPPVLIYDPGRIAPAPPPGLIRRDRPQPEPQPDRPIIQVHRGDAHRSAELLTLGDRTFRVKNYKRAEKRYLQALGVDPDSAAPHVRLAQIALVREQYHEAAARFREAEIAQPGWIASAPDIQAIYGEPADFAEPLAKLQAHLHTHPNDRDAWLVLGAQWFLSGRTRPAADVFLRLDDAHRRPEPLLDAFLVATNQPRAAKPDPNDDPAKGGDPFKAPAP
jgi:hypothetical protein